jgi:hypothetical protein
VRQRADGAVEEMAAQTDVAAGAADAVEGRRSLKKAQAADCRTPPVRAIPVVQGGAARGTEVIHNDGCRQSPHTATWLAVRDRKGSAPWRARERIACMRPFTAQVRVRTRAKS